MTAHERAKAITCCVEQIERAIELQTPGDMESLLWEMDQRAELHRLLYEEVSR